VLAADDDLLREPHVVLGGHFLDVVDAVEAPGPSPVGVAVVHLGLVPVLRPPCLLVLGVEIDPRIGLGEGHHVDLEVEVLEIVVMDVADVEEMGDRAVDDNHPIANLERVGILAHLPAVETLAVEEADPAGLGLGPFDRRSIRRQGHQQGKTRKRFHESILLPVVQQRSRRECQLYAPSDALGSDSVVGWLSEPTVLPVLVTTVHVN